MVSRLRGNDGGAAGADNVHADAFAKWLLGAVA